VLGIMLLVLALVLYLPYVREGGGPRATTFWAIVACGNLCFLLWGRFRLASLLSLAGAAMNATVIIANGGYMPVVGLEEPMGAWRPADAGSHLLLLADRMAIGGFSPGDVVLMAALLVLAGRCLLSVGKSLRLVPARA
jgi:hypothetical protein